MRVLVVALVMVVAGLAARAPVFEEIPVAQACSCPDCDGIRDSDVIVGGRITGWTPSERQPFPPRQETIPLDIALRVDRVFKGVATTDLVLFDPSSLSEHNRDGAQAWMGGSGGCQAFDSDPSGAYIVVGYDVSGPVAMNVSGPLVMFRGAEPEGERWDRLVALLNERLGPPYPPAVGDSPPAAPAESSDDWMFASAIGGGFLLITLVLLLAGPKREPRDATTRDPGRGDEAQASFGSNGNSETPRGVL